MQSESKNGETEARRSYWKTNVVVITILLAIWAAASVLASIVFIEPLNQFSIGNLPFGFWMANQGSMLIFVVLILVYAIVMDQIDRRFKRRMNQGVSHDR